MANNLRAGNNGCVALPEADGVSFEDAGFNSTNCSIIHQIGNPNKSWVPGRTGNSIESFVGDEGYYIVMKQAADKTAYLAPPIGTSGPTPEPDPTVFLDNFNGAAGPLSGHTPDLGTVTGTGSLAINGSGKLVAGVGAYYDITSTKPAKRRLIAVIDALVPESVVGLYIATNGSENCIAYLFTDANGNSKIEIHAGGIVGSPSGDATLSGAVTFSVEINGSSVTATAGPLSITRTSSITGAMALVSQDKVTTYESIRLVSI